MSPWPQTHSVPPGPLTRDLPPAPGVTLVDGGADVAVYAGHADGVAVCLFEPDDVTGESEVRIPLRERAHGWWFGLVPDMDLGQRYGFRVAGPWDPSNGLRYNADKLLVDPYARAIEGEVRWGPEVFGHEVDAHWRGDGETRSRLDSRGHIPRAVVVDDEFDWEGDELPGHSRSDTVIYEAHVRNQTMLHPGVPPELRGTYAGLAHPASIEHLTSLGVTAVELLPIHAFTHEPHLVRSGLVNHWGYNTLAFHAPHPGYAAATQPQDVVDEVKGMVKLLHRAGLEVILDVVYNHSAEQGRTGPMLSFRGLDQRAYYRLDGRGYDVDVTGCGNTLDLSHPVVCRMVLDSLRRWVQDFHVDGFRFDLAVALGRGRGDDFDRDHPILVALRVDPVLSRVKLISEPWDLGIHGWRTGEFPPPFMDWNDRFRDTVRRFWVADARSLAHGGSAHDSSDLATRLAGSRDLFSAYDRGPTASINFVAAHDGFTVHDLVSYNHKHNEANGEGNRDGSNDNCSWNHGVEGPTEDAEVLAARRRSIRNLLGTLLLSTGVPMIAAGDELGRTQHGSNNPYCQDNELSWVDWHLEDWQRDLLATTSRLTALRRALPVLRQRSWSMGVPVDGDILDMEWYAHDGDPMGERWAAPDGRVVQMLVAAAEHTPALLVLNGTPATVEVTPPKLLSEARVQLLWDSSLERPGEIGEPAPPGPTPVPGMSMRLYAVTGTARASGLD